MLHQCLVVEEEESHVDHFYSDPDASAGFIAVGKSSRKAGYSHGMLSILTISCSLYTCLKFWTQNFDDDDDDLAHAPDPTHTGSCLYRVSGHTTGKAGLQKLRLCFESLCNRRHLVTAKEILRFPSLPGDVPWDWEAGSIDHKQLICCSWGEGLINCQCGPAARQVFATGHLSVDTGISAGAEGRCFPWLLRAWPHRHRTWSKLVFVFMLGLCLKFYLLHTVLCQGSSSWKLVSWISVKADIKCQLEPKLHPIHSPLRQN